MNEDLLVDVQRPKVGNISVISLKRKQIMQVKKTIYYYFPALSSFTTYHRVCN